MASIDLTTAKSKCLAALDIYHHANCPMNIIHRLNQHYQSIRAIHPSPVSEFLRRRLRFQSVSSLIHALHACVILVRCVEAFMSSLEADLLLGWRMHIRWMLRRRRGMMGFNPPQPECQVIDCEAAYYNRNANDLHKSW